MFRLSDPSPQTQPLITRAWWSEASPLGRVVRDGDVDSRHKTASAYFSLSEPPHLPLPPGEFCPLKGFMATSKNLSGGSSSPSLSAGVSDGPAAEAGSLYHLLLSPPPGLKIKSPPTTLFLHASLENSPSFEGSIKPLLFVQGIKEMP